MKKVRKGKVARHVDSRTRNKSRNKNKSKTKKKRKAQNKVKMNKISQTKATRLSRL